MFVDGDGDAEACAARHGGDGEGAFGWGGCACCGREGEVVHADVFDGGEEACSLGGVGLTLPMVVDGVHRDDWRTSVFSLVLGQQVLNN